MQSQQAIQHVFAQLSQSMQQMTEQDYSASRAVLFNASIGQHVRHIIELFTSLENGYKTGTVNYEKRKRDNRIETDKNFAIESLKRIYTNLDKGNRELLLETSGEDVSAEIGCVNTNYFREILYNLEHTVHHMALIRVGINEMDNFTLPADFGVASATIQYRKSIAQ
jgi:hypothetical protein